MNRGIPAGNPIANIFVIVVGALAIAASIVLGFVAFIVLGSIVAVLASIIGLRLWWFNRKIKRRTPPASADQRDPSDGVIEGEYRVIEKSRSAVRDD